MISLCNKTISCILGTMNLSPKLQSLLNTIERQAETLVWWSPDQITRGEDKENDPTKGNRPWSVPRTTGAFLHEVILKRKATSVLELGTSIGYSTIWIASALQKNNGKMHTVEMKQEKFDVAKENIIQGGFEGVITMHLGQIKDILKNLDATLMFDFVFLDADRGHYHEYFPLIKKHLLPGALIIADNAENMNSRMKPFFDLLEQEHYHFEIKDMDNGLLIASDQAEHHNN